MRTKNYHTDIRTHNDNLDDRVGWVVVSNSTGKVVPGEFLTEKYAAKQARLVQKSDDDLRGGFARADILTS